MAPDDHLVPGDAAAVRAAADVLRRGGLVAFPTETVYGLGADASQPRAVERIFTVKGRPTGHPLIVHLGDAALLDAWASVVPPTARLLADVFWPGPLTLVLPRADRVPDVVTGGRATVGLRVPDHPLALALLAEFGGGVAAPSANRFGRVSPTTAADVRAELGDAVDLVLDGGPCPVGVESTIVDLSGAEPEMLRPGGVAVERLTEVLGRPPLVHGGGASPDAAVLDATGGARAPGMLPAHYAPAARVIVASAAEVADRAGAALAAGATVGVLAPHSSAGLPDGVVELEPAGPPEEFARLLYARLRQADRLGLDVLVVVAPPAVGVGVAVRDRLARAAAAHG